MKAGQFFRKNILIIAGLALPALVMIFFMVSTMMPTHIKNPPKYDLVFAVQDYTTNNRSPLNINFVVKDGVLYAQYIKNIQNHYYNWKKLYLYNAKTQTVKQLSFGFPAKYTNFEGMKEEVVAATKNMKFDTTLQSPDGYQLAQRCHRRSTGIFGELFIGNRYNYPCLKKEGTSINLMGNEAKNYYYAGHFQFIGWVIP